MLHTDIPLLCGLATSCGCYPHACCVLLWLCRLVEHSGFRCDSYLELFRFIPGYFLALNIHTTINPSLGTIFTGIWAYAVYHRRLAPIMVVTAACCSIIVNIICSCAYHQLPDATFFNHLYVLLHAGSTTRISTLEAQRTYPPSTTPELCPSRAPPCSRRCASLHLDSLSDAHMPLGQYERDGHHD